MSEPAGRPTGERVAHDSMGEVRIPAGARWGASTQRAVDNFPVSGQRIDAALVQALARVKAAAALENARLGVLDDDLAAAIAADVGTKWAGHSIGQVNFIRPDRSMSQIGG